MVRRSWMALPISFNGPLETIQEIVFFLSRAGYAGVDQSVSANWLDHVRFFDFFCRELLRQFAVIGTLAAGAGFAVQWRMLGRRVAAFMTVAFLGPSVLLLLLLGLDYDSFRAHVFHVFPLPAYAIGALWMALGLRGRYSVTRAGHRTRGRGSGLARRGLRERRSYQSARG